LLANLVKRRRAERFLMQAEEEARRHREQINLLSRVSLLGEMTASLAHELNQPLSAIVSNANAGMRFIDRGKEDPKTLRDILVERQTGAAPPTSSRMCATQLRKAMLSGAGLI
jgi:C4-dicarboxylate-specific signal transduction histidine kinase